MDNVATTTGAVGDGTIYYATASATATSTATDTSTATATATGSATTGTGSVPTGSVTGIGSGNCSLGVLPAPDLSFNTCNLASSGAPPVSGSTNLNTYT